MTSTSSITSSTTTAITAKNDNADQKSPDTSLTKRIQNTFASTQKRTSSRDSRQSSNNSFWKERAVSKESSFTKVIRWGKTLSIPKAKQTKDNTQHSAPAAKEKASEVSTKEDEKRNFPPKGRVKERRALFETKPEPSPSIDHVGPWRRPPAEKTGLETDRIGLIDSRSSPQTPPIKKPTQKSDIGVQCDLVNLPKHSDTPETSGRSIMHSAPGSRENQLGPGQPSVVNNYYNTYNTTNNHPDSKSEKTGIDATTSMETQTNSFDELEGIGAPTNTSQNPFEIDVVVTIKGKPYRMQTTLSKDVFQGDNEIKEAEERKKWFIEAFKTEVLDKISGCNNFPEDQFFSVSFSNDMYFATIDGRSTPFFQMEIGTDTQSEIWLIKQVLQNNIEFEPSSPRGTMHSSLTPQASRGSDDEDDELESSPRSTTTHSSMPLLIDVTHRCS